MLSPGSPLASDTSQAVLNSMSAPLLVSHGYVCSSDVATGSAATPGRPEPSAKQQLGPTKSLPSEVLLKVFRLMKPKQVHTAALVCRSWRTAAKAAVTSISVHYYSSDHSLTRKAVSLRQWIYRNGASVQKIRIVGYTSGKLALPLSELQRLQALSVSRLKLIQWTEPASSTAETCDAAADVCPDIGVMCGVSAINQTSEALDGLSLLTSLTKLSLDGYPSENYNMLSALTRLQELYVKPGNGLVTPRAQGKISAAALQQLTRLTSLSISPSAVEHSTTGSFSKLTSLQSLDYTRQYVQHTTELKGLPDSLTRLKAVWDGTPLLTRQLAPDLTKLTSLQHLELSAAGFYGRGCISPCVIRDMSQLTYLALVEVCTDTLGSKLSAVGTLLQLRHLKLSNRSVDGVARAVQQDLNQYSALTASSHLTYLGLVTARPMFTAGVGDYMFPPGRQLPDLKILMLGRDPEAMTAVVGDYAYPILNQQALDRIVVNCPAIEQLSLIDAVAKIVDELVTAQLSGLTKLAINGLGVYNSTVKHMSARLGQLRDLKLDKAEVTDLGVWEMTRFARLTRLEMKGPFPESETSAGLMRDGVYLECNKRRSTPVWQQLQAAVRRRSAKCAGVMLDRAERTSQESRNRLAATHQQLSAVQKQLQQAMQAGPGAEQQLQLEQVQQQLMAAVELVAGVDLQAREAEGVGQSDPDGQVHGSDSDADDLSSDYSSDDESSGDCSD